MHLETRLIISKSVSKSEIVAHIENEIQEPFVASRSPKSLLNIISQFLLVHSFRWPLFYAPRHLATKDIFIA